MIVIHLSPAQDGPEHENNIGCWCDPQPRRVQPGVRAIIHNGRDDQPVELSPEGWDALVKSALAA